MKKKISGEIIRQKQIATGIYSMWIATGLSEEARPGQFIGVYPKDKSALLPRPISICEVDKDKRALRIVYRVVGKGTDEFSHLSAGDDIKLIGILGNGYDTSITKDKSAVTLMAGGIGIPPMVELAKQLMAEGKQTSIILGYRDSETFLSEELAKYGNVYIATDDGSIGFCGNVIDALAYYKLTPDIICACGPMPMLRGVKTYSEAHDIEALISLEERMACGVGACLGCVCRTKDTDPHSHVKNARICTDGPVFYASEVDI